MLLWKISHLILPLNDNAKLAAAVAAYNEKLLVFTELRQALGAAPKSTSNGLTKISVTQSAREIKKIRRAVVSFMKKLEKRIKSNTNQPMTASFIKLQGKMEEHKEKLLADPIIREVNGERRVFAIHRTNNIMENHFREFNYLFRRIHGNISIRKNLEKMPEQLPLVKNLKNPDYIKLVFDDVSKIAMRFSKVDTNKIKKMAKQHQQQKLQSYSRKGVKITRMTDFEDKLILAFTSQMQSIS